MRTQSLAVFCVCAFFSVSCESNPPGDSGGRGDDDTTSSDFTTQLALLSCTTGQYAEWDGSAWICADPVVDTTLSETEVETYVTNDALDLAAGTTLASQAIALGQHTTDTTLSESDVVTYATNHGFLTSESDPTVNALGKAALSCADGEIPKWDADATTWLCMPDAMGTGGAFTDASGTAYYVDGNVGIGTTSPSTALEVSGDLTVTGEVDIGGTLYARARNVASEPVTCDASQAGLLYFDTTSEEFRGCDGVAWSRLGPPRLPSLLQAGLTTTITAPNTDNSCGVSAGSPWTTLPGLSIDVPLERTTEIEVRLTGDIGDYASVTPGLHCAVRYLIDGSVAPGADANFGHYAESTDTYRWFGLYSGRRFSLTPGTHTVAAEGRSGLCGTPGGSDTGYCHFSTQVAMGTKLEVLVP